MREQRAYKRLDLEADVCLKSGNGRPRIFNAFLDDISFGGFQMYAQDRLDVDECVEFEVMTRLLDRPFKGRGVVRHANAREKYNTNFFSMGVEFVGIDKREVTLLIKKLLGWKDELVYYKPRKRELSLLLKFVPLITLITWVVLKMTSHITTSINEEQKYTQKLKEGIIYYLYNRQ